MKNHEEFFWLTMLCSFIGGVALGLGYYSNAVNFFILGAIALILKWIFIAVDKREAQRNGKIN